MSYPAQDESYSQIIAEYFDFAPVPMLLIDLKGKVIRFNDEVSELSGYSREEIEGLSVTELPFLLPEDISLVKEQFVKRIKGEDVKPYNLKIKRKDGGIVVGKVTGSVIKSKVGIPKAAIVVVADVTEDVENLSSERSYAEQIKHYLNVVDDIILELNSDGTIGLINEAGMKLLGYKDKNKIIGKSWFDHIPERDRDNVREIFKANISGSKDYEYHTNAVVGLDGKEYEIKWHNISYRDDDGKVVALVSYGKNITEQIKTSSSLQKVEEELSLIMSHSSEIYYINSVVYYKLDYVSPQCRDMTGYDPVELKGDWRIVLSDNPINKKVITHTKLALDTGEKQPKYFMEIKTKSGEIKMTEVDETPIKDDSGKVVGLGGVVRDVSDRFRIENELRERVNQLESMNRVVVGRELKMVELKEQNEKLKRELSYFKDKS